MKTDKQKDRKGKLKRIYDQEEGKIRKQLSFAKAEIERLKENRKITKKGRLATWREKSRSPES